MSLINEALKKAQKQRTGDTPSLTAMPAIGGESAQRIARRGKPEGFNTLVLWISLGVVGLAVVIAVTVMVLRRPSPPAVPPATSTTTAATTAPATAPKPVEAAPVVAAPVTPAVVAPTVAVAPPTQTAAATQPAASTTVIFVPAEKPKPAEVTPIQLAPAPTPEPAKLVVPGAPRKLEPRAINYINSIRVAGIRASSSDSKVLMNDRVYRVGDLVEAEMGLKLAGITPNSLTFEDENGGRFTRTF